MPNVGAALAVILVSAVQLAGCSSSSKSITSLDSDKTLSSLTTKERRQYCEDRTHYVSSRVSPDDRRKIKCAAAASEVGSTGASAVGKAKAVCQTVYQTCMSLPPPEPSSPCEGFPASAADCTATVGDANACAEDQADALEKLASGADATCSRVGQTRRQMSQAPETSDACSRVQLLCPKLFEEPALDRSKP